MAYPATGPSSKPILRVHSHDSHPKHKVSAVKISLPANRTFSTGKTSYLYSPSDIMANQKGYFVHNLIGVLFLTSLPVILFLLAWLYPRPLDTTLPSVFDGDGTEIDYCKMPDLDDSGMLARAFLRHLRQDAGIQFSATHFRRVYRILTKERSDIRGLWQSIDPRLPDHVEHIEQCGDRVVVTLTDYSRPFLRYTIQRRRTEADGPFCFVFGPRKPRLFGRTTSYIKIYGGPTVVKRYIENGKYRWEYPGMGTIK